MSDPEAFEINLNGLTVVVSIHTIRSARVFHVIYPDKRPPLNITVAENTDGKKFWTSVPEGRQDEAEFAGRIIAAYIREYRRTQLCATTTDKKLPGPNLFG